MFTSKQYFPLSAVLLIADILTIAFCGKCHYTECNVLSRQKCPPGYTEEESIPCVFGLFGRTYLCCKTDADVPTPTSTTAGPPPAIKCERVEQSELPYVVALTRVKDSKSYHFCDGSILFPNWVLTSARCLFDEDKNQLKSKEIVVTAASLDLQVLEGTEQIVTGDQFYIHEDYDISNITQYANIALLRVTQPFEFNDFVSSIDLPPEGFVTKLISNGITSGWKIADLSSPDYTSSFLQKVNVPIIDDTTCSEIYTSQAEPKGQIKTHGDSQLCSAGSSQHENCPNDNGGPLQCESFVCGITSRSGPEGLPDIYTDVTFFRQFIENTMGTAK